MYLFKEARTFLVCGAFLLALGAGVAVTACVMPRSPYDPADMSEPSPVELMVSYARRHPDSTISGAFADKLRSGEIETRVEKPKEHAMASFGMRDGGYVLTIDPERLKQSPTEAEEEDVLSILSHEHAHYRQFVEGQMTNYHPTDVTMSDTQCTLIVLVEIDAHGKACRDAQAYGWTSRVAQNACDRTMASIADYLLTERSFRYPECKPTWEFYSRHVPGKRVGKPKARSTKILKKRRGDFYLPPP